MGEHKRFCVECSCTGEPENCGDHEPYIEENWHCPLLGGNICQTCCRVELEGGMGAMDTLESVMRKSGKGRTTVHSICMACPHGGSDLERPPRLTGTKGSDGTMKCSGPELEMAQKELEEEWREKLEWLTGRTIERLLPPEDPFVCIDLV